MNSKAETCPKCGKGMEEGFIADNTFPAKVFPGVWVAGPPEESGWSGKGSAKIVGKTKRTVRVYRCVGCGYLEAYATIEWPGT